MLSGRLAGLITKAFAQFLRDPVMLFVVIFLYTAELVMCTMALGFDVQHLKLAVVDHDRSAVSRALIEEFVPLAGDRYFAEDQAIVGGLGRFRGQSVVVIGHEKGDDTESRIRHNFGMARPEGYRKAVRLMEMADRFNLPVITLVDTAGAYPGLGAEERGQAEAIARSTEKCLQLGVPIVTVVIGEGGSGGAVAIATGDRVYMLEHATYSVISPEGCASILWRDASRAEDAASAMRVTAQDLMEFHVIDDIIPEPIGGAHRDSDAMLDGVGKFIERALDELCGQSPDDLKRQRREKFLQIGRTLPIL